MLILFNKMTKTKVGIVFTEKIKSACPELLSITENTLERMWAERRTGTSSAMNFGYVRTD